MCRVCGLRHNSYENNPSSGTSQEANLDANGAIPFSFGMRSTGKGSPLRGRSVKECEEQLDHLKKENFKLKLRIYFLEERMGQKGINMDKEELAKANMELKVEMESLKKELYDKQELLRQASNLLSSMETQYTEEIEKAKFIGEQGQEELRERVNYLEKEVSDYAAKVANAEVAAVSNLTQLCDLAFDSAADEVPSLNMDPRHPHENGAMQGVFSLPTTMASTLGSENIQALNGLRIETQFSKATAKTESDLRIEELEAKVKELEDQVEDLEEQLSERERTADALEEDISNLKRQLEDREEKLVDLEMEVNEKDLKVDQLMGELETRHLEIEAKDSSIQTLHQELEKVEPAIEVKVQEVVERDRIIEQKIEQLQQQNKILVEIQITLDEKQKQIAELEANLQDALNKAEKVNQEFEISCETIKGMASEICSRDREISHLQRELKRKEKKIKDLIAELKEATDMLKKAKWEAETSSCGEDGVKEMVEEENERLWAQLEQGKKQLVDRDAALKEAELRVEDLRNMLTEMEEKMQHLAKKSASPINNERSKTDTEIPKTDVENIFMLKAEIIALQEKANSRDKMMKEQHKIMDDLKNELNRARDMLDDKNRELSEMKIEISKKGAQMNDFLMKELFGKSDEIKNLQSGLFGMKKSGNDDPLQALKLFLQANQLGKEEPRIDTNTETKIYVPSQVRSSSLSHLQKPDDESSKTDEKPHSPKPGRSNSFSALENALYAQMGQKVYNTNQTFNTYVLPDQSERSKDENDPKSSTAENIISQMHETYPNYLTGELPLSTPDIHAMLGGSKNTRTKPTNSSISGSQPEASEGTPPIDYKVRKHAETHSTTVLLTNPPNVSIPTRDVLATRSTLITQSMPPHLSQIDHDNSLDNLNITDANISLVSIPLTALSNYDDVHRSATSSECSTANPIESGVASGDCTDYTIGKVKRYKVSNTPNIETQIETLKNELQKAHKNVTSQMLNMASKKYSESVKKYKEEILSLRRRLILSRKAAESLKSGMEELASFLEKILEMERKGLIDLSHITGLNRSSLNQTLNCSRSLCDSFNQSMLMERESMLPSDTLESRFSLPLDKLTEQFDISAAVGNNMADESSMAETFLDIPEDLSTFDLTINFDELSSINFDLPYQSVAEKVCLQIDSKAKEVESIALELNQLNLIIESREKQLIEQSTMITILKNEIIKLRMEVTSKDAQLNQNTEQNVPEIILPQNQMVINPDDESSSSLHLSALQQSLPNFEISENIQNCIHSLDSIPSSISKGNSIGTLPPIYPSRGSLPNISARSVENALLNASSNSKSEGAMVTVNEVTAQKILLSSSMADKTACDPLLLNVADACLGENGDPSAQPSFIVASPSESEAWSEPDRNVSLARIGIDTLGSTTHDRSLSRCRVGRTTPFTSESDAELNPEEKEIGSPNQTSNAKLKRRSDLAEIKRLNSKLKNVEQMNETLRAELHIYQTLSQQFCRAKDIEEKNKPKTSDKCVETYIGDIQISANDELALSNVQVSSTPAVLKEIRCLRLKLEEAIDNNDLLRDQLEAALAGYLSEESKNITTQLAMAQQELKLYKDEISAACNIEQILRDQVRDECSKSFELSERLADHITKSQELQKNVIDLGEEISSLKNKLELSEAERKRHLITIENISSLSEVKENELNGACSQLKQFNSTIDSLQTELNKLTQDSVNNEVKIADQSKYISSLEESKADFEERVLKQDEAIADLCKGIASLKDEVKSSKTDPLIAKLESALKVYDIRLDEATKDRFTLLGEKARLEAELASSQSVTEVLQKEINNMSESEETSIYEYDELIQRLKGAQMAIKDMEMSGQRHITEKQILQKDVHLLKEEIVVLRSRLDRVLSQDSIHCSRESREITNLRSANSKLKENSALLESSLENLRVENGYLKERLDKFKELLKESEQRLAEKEAQIRDLSLQLDEEKLYARRRQSNNISNHPVIDSKYSPSHKAHLSPSSKYSTEHVRFARDSRSTLLQHEDDKENINYSMRLDSALNSKIIRSSDNLRSYRQDFGDSTPFRSLQEPLDESYSSLRNINSSNLYKFNSNPRVEHSSHDTIISQTISEPPNEEYYGANIRSSRVMREGRQKRIDRVNKVMSEGDILNEDDVVICNETSDRLCHDPSHSLLAEERLKLSEENAKLSSTLKGALDKISRANQRKENVEKAICKELTKTHQVLKKASINLKRSKEGCTTRDPKQDDRKKGER